MFKNSEEHSSEAETIIGPSVKVEGDLNAVGNVIIEGSVSGNITTDKNITVGTKAEINADIKSDNANISGSIKGSLNITGHLDVKSSAKINGDITTKTISIESGAQINGSLSMGGAPSVVDNNHKEEKREES